MKIEDEGGNQWLVLAGDAANDAIGVLRRRGYEYVVLPRKLLCGILTVLPCEPASWQPPSSATSPERLVRAIRLYDCLVELKKESERG